MENKIRPKYKKILKSIMWDYNLEPDAMMAILKGKKSMKGYFGFEKLFIRVLERLSWYDILSLFGIDFIKEKLTPDIINKIRFKELRENYEYIRKIFQGESVSVSGWSAEYRKRIKHSLLSNRWYSSQQALL